MLVFCIFMRISVFVFFLGIFFPGLAMDGRLDEIDGWEWIGEEKMILTWKEMIGCVYRREEERMASAFRAIWTCCLFVFF